jgi:GDPmannose 4,6-dehydratase
MKVLITGITGQDGSYLAELLLSEGHDVVGLRRRTSTFNTSRIDHIYKDSHLSGRGIELVHGDMSDSSSLTRVIADTKPDQIFNLAAQSHVAVSFDEPEYTADSIALGTLRLFEAVRNLKAESLVKIYQASTSELFGGLDRGVLNELSPFNPRSPYAAAKMYAHSISQNYREGYGFFSSNGILFNHESPRRGPTFVTRKITMGLTKIFLGSEQPLYLGNIDAVRDWGHAKDYVRAMAMMLNAAEPDDFVVATGVGHTVREFLLTACEILDIKTTFVGDGLNEKLLDERTGRILVEIDPRYYRPLEVHHLIGSYTKINSTLGWEPSTSFDSLVNEMIQEDLKYWQLAKR